MARITYDPDRFDPQPYHVRLTKPGEERLWEQQQCWTVGLDWRPGGPTFLSTVLLTELFYRLIKMYGRQIRDAEQFQLAIVPLNEEGEEEVAGKTWFVPTMPIDDRQDREAWQAWHSTAA